MVSEHDYNRTQHRIDPVAARCGELQAGQGRLMDSTETLIDDLRAHLAQLPGHVAQRESARLMLRAVAELVALSRGEFICKKCGRRQDAQPLHFPGDF